MQSSVSFYTYDGLGSVRGITDASGELQETYDYDAYGTLIALAKRNATSGELEPADLTSSDSALRTPRSEFLFTGEQWDADLGMYFLRARYLNTQTGRFHTQDTYEGRNGEPLTLHKYLYVHGNPVMGTDPSGKFLLTEIVLGGILAHAIDKPMLGVTNALLSVVKTGLFKVAGGFAQQYLRERGYKLESIFSFNFVPNSDDGNEITAFSLDQSFYNSWAFFQAGAVAQIAQFALTFGALGKLATGIIENIRSLGAISAAGGMISAYFVKQRVKLVLAGALGIIETVSALPGIIDNPLNIIKEMHYVYWMTADREFLLNKQIFTFNEN